MRDGSITKVYPNKGPFREAEKTPRFHHIPLFFDDEKNKLRAFPPPHGPKFQYHLAPGATRLGNQDKREKKG